MKIEDEIKQSTFRNEHHKLAVNLAFTANWLGRVTAQTLKPYKLTPQQYNVLRILRGQKPNPASINLITERMIDKMSNASRLVEKLLKKKLVERTTCESDRRQVDVKITQKGESLLRELDPLFDDLNLMLGSVSKDDAATLNRLLDAIRG